MSKKRIANVPPELRRMLVPIDDVKPLDGNRRRGDVDEVRASLRHHGQYKPIIARRETSEVLVGNHTTQAAREEGWTHIAVLWRSEPSDDEAKRLALVDNRTSDLAEWDVAGLAADLVELSDAGGLAGTGFSEEAMQETLQLARQLAGSEAARALAQAGDDTDAGPKPKRPKTRPGDLILLGDHRLLCGDATVPDDVALLMASELAQLGYHDPPYGVDYDGGHSGGGIYRRERLVGDERGTDIYAAAMPAFLAATDKKAPLYLWHASTLADTVFAAVRGAGYEVRATIIWAKQIAQNGALSSHYKQKHEALIYAVRKGKPPRWHGPTNEVTVWDYPRAMANEFHPTQKPVEVGERVLTNATLPGDAVLDLFGGSGSTLIAATNLGRRAYLMELDPGYCDVIVDRWERHTGLTADRPARRRRAPKPKEPTT